MATDATGTPTSPDNIPTYNTAGDPPSGKGFNAAMAAIQTALSARMLKSIVTTAGDLLYGTGASAVTRLGIGSAGQVLTVAGGVPTWAAPSGAVTTIFDVVVGRGNAGDPAGPAATIDSNTILGGNIPGTYKHLRLVLSGRTTIAATNDQIKLQLNNDTAGNYDWQETRGIAAAVGGAEAAAASYIQAAYMTGGSMGAGVASSMISEIPDYAGTTFQKMVETVFNLKMGTTAGSSSFQTGRSSGWWRNTAAVTRLAVTPVGGSFLTGTRLTLYGIN